MIKSNLSFKIFYLDIDSTFSPTVIRVSKHSIQLTSIFGLHLSLLYTSWGDGVWVALSTCLGECECVHETIHWPSGWKAFNISWAQHRESIHAVIKCFESMFWIIFSNCLRAIKLPNPTNPTNLTLKMRESKSKRKEAAGKDSTYFLWMTSALPVQKLFVPRFVSAKQQTLLGIWASYIYALSIWTSHYMNVSSPIKW